MLNSNQEPCGSTVKTYRRALSQLVSSHHLDVEVFGLRLAPGLNEPVQHLKAMRTEGDKVTNVLF